MIPPLYIHLGEPCPQAPVGASHWWGYPDLPPDVDIPTVDDDGEVFGLTLICQINLQDLPADHPFHGSGLLLFFADIAYYGGYWDEPSISMYPSDNRAVRVIHIPAERMGELVNRSGEYADDELPPVAITVDRRPTSLDEPENQLFGTSSHLEWEDWPEPCRGWQLLLQMDSMEAPDYSYNFVDYGTLCFLISPAALMRSDFTDTRAIILST